MESFHHEQFPVYRIMELIHQCRGSGNVGIRKQNMPSWLLALYPFSHPHPVFFSPKMRHLFSKSPQSLRKRPAVRGFASFLDEKDLPKLATKRLTYGFGNSFYLGRQLERSMQHAVGELGKSKELGETFAGTIESVGEYPQSLIGQINGFRRPLKLAVRLGKRIDRLGR